ncbi:hypothetical protein ILYODFUR_036080 [Ilyodon furcidens]|uniref:Secreted protein n=1 Tax=Ilyodon furcidens TaxID=33524 RepID=A0ABV0T327_9TELE
MWLALYTVCTGLHQLHYLPNHFQRQAFFKKKMNKIIPFQGINNVSFNYTFHLIYRNIFNLPVPPFLSCFYLASQSFSTAYSIVGHGGAGAYLQQSTGRRRGSPWTGRQSIAGQHTNNHAHTHSYT